MPDKLKDIFFTKESIAKLSHEIKKKYTQFDQEKFEQIIFDSQWNLLELKDKMYHVSKCLYEKLPKDYKKALDILIKIAPVIKGFEGITFPDFVEKYGQYDWDLSLPALEHFTKYSTSEYAIRPFIVKDANRTMKFLSKLAESKNENVRRFASEGCRPRLPWAMALPMFKKNPEPIIEILEKLKDDESNFVRKSVANNLNDISKDNPEISMDICEKWYGKSKNTDWIVKHACRGMLKEGNKRALMLFGFGNPENFAVRKYELGKKKIKIGEFQNFSFDLEVKTKNESKVRLEYLVEFVKLKGKRSKKIFQIKEVLLSPGVHKINKKHSFKDYSTRKHNPGTHTISIVVNGEEKDVKSFELA